MNNSIIKLLLLFICSTVPLLTFASNEITSVDIYTSITSDGYIFADGQTIDEIRTRTAGTARTNYQMYAGLTNWGPDFYRLHRSFLSFPTIEIPEEAVITEASLYFYGLISYPDEHNYLRLVEATPALPTQLSSSDFDSIGDINDPKFFSDLTITPADMRSLNLSNTIAEFPLNSNALAKLSSSDYISFAILDGHDLENATIPNVGYNMARYVWSMRDTPAPGSYWGHFPYVKVKYYIPSNTPPILTTSLNYSVDESMQLSFVVSATDSENDSLMYSISNLPLGATFDSQTQTFNWTPGYDDAGTYEVVFSVTDGEFSDTATATIEVLNTNRAPILEAIGNQTVSENQNLSFTLSASDPDGDNLTYSALNLPSGASFDPSTLTFNWTPGYNDAGNYTDIEFTVVDDGSPMELDVELITITVGNINRAPEFVSTGAQEVLEDEQLTFSVSATDPDNDSFVLSAQNLPSGASFDAQTGTFSWTPTLSQEGVYTVTFSATDNGTPAETGSMDVVITVGDNPTPVEQSEDLIEDIVTLDIPANVENSYMANLQKVATFIEEGKIHVALNQLNAFINKVNQDYAQGILTQEERDQLVDAAEDLIADLQ